jgi:hypothetical protein
VVLTSRLVLRHQIQRRRLTGHVASFSAMTNPLRIPLLCGVIPPKLFSSPARRPLVLRTPSQYFSRGHTHSSLEKNGPLPSSSTSLQPAKNPRIASTIRENIYTIPNALTISRILACPVLGWAIVKGDFVLATSLLAYAGITDWVSRIYHTVKSSPGGGTTCLTDL